MGVGDKLGLRELNQKGMYTKDQLMSWKKFEGKYLAVYPHHYEYWVDGKGYVTVYELRGISDDSRENYELVEDIC